MADQIEPCYWYCKHRHTCPDHCVNDFTSCQFCAWFYDENLEFKPCDKFELDEEEYKRLGEVLEKLNS